MGVSNVGNTASSVQFSNAAAVSLKMQGEAESLASLMDQIAEIMAVARSLDDQIKALQDPGPRPGENATPAQRQEWEVRRQDYDKQLASLTKQLDDLKKNLDELQGEVTDCQER